MKYGVKTHLKAELGQERGEKRDHARPDSQVGVTPGKDEEWIYICIQEQNQVEEAQVQGQLVPDTGPFVIQSANLATLGMPSMSWAWNA